MKIRVQAEGASGNPRQAERGVLEAEASEKGGDGGVRPRVKGNIEVETGTFAAAR
jgi:hypothetical protein